MSPVIGARDQYYTAFKYFYDLRSKMVHGVIDEIKSPGLRSKGPFWFGRIWLMKFDEKKFRDSVEPHLLRCRDGDWNHALRVVGWVKELGEGRRDLALLIVAAYVHDIGWRDVLPPGRISLKKLLKFEDRANRNSKPFVADLLKELGYSEKQINVVGRLIEAADAHISTQDDEAVIIDADNLSKLSIDHLREKFKKSEWVKLYRLWEKEFPQRIKTQKGKRLYPTLLAKLRVSLRRT